MAEITLTSQDLTQDAIKETFSQLSARLFGAGATAMGGYGDRPRYLSLPA